MTQFTFAILSDTHIRSPHGDLSSPFPVNEKANGRARHAVELIRTNAPDFTIHLGDMIHPLPHMSAYGEAADEAHSIFAPLKPNLHFVGGNHDSGDKPSPAMPAKSADTDSIDVFRTAFGEPWYTFEHADIAVVVMNSSLVNSGLELEQQQRSWLEETLSALKRKRIFLFSHYPPFITAADEQDHYDNYAEPGRSWFLELAAQSGVEAIFSGHVHHFFFNRYKNVKLYCLPATSFTRQDYAEMFPVDPASEYGRDDEGKFGITLIDVTKTGHRLRILRTDGQQRTAETTDKLQPDTPQATPLIPHLRHAWFEPRRLPYNGPMEEFARKVVRNDYPLLRLKQLGITTVRTPLSDLDDEQARARIDDWISSGQKFVFFGIGIPTEKTIHSLNELGNGVTALEILTTRSDLSDIASQLPDVMSQCAVPVWLSKVTTSADRPRADGIFAHAVSSGFLASELPVAKTAVNEALSTMTQIPSASLVVQIEWGEDPGTVIPSLLSTLQGTNLGLVPNVRLADSNPAVANFDDTAIAQTLATAIASATAAGIPLQCDTFEDLDRGYNPRHGLIDRRCNMRDIL